MATKPNKRPFKGRSKRPRKRPDPIWGCLPVPRFRRPWWEREPEIAAYVRGLFGTMRVVDIPAAVASRFGPDRAPSKSGVSRFMTLLRGGPFQGNKFRRVSHRSKPLDE